MSKRAFCEWLKNFFGFRQVHLAQHEAHSEHRRRQQELGASRAQLIASTADSYLRQNMDDLGASDRTVGFIWEPEADGSHSLWYALADARNGAGSFQRVPEGVDPNSQVAYYARLFGVRLPGQ